MGVPAPEVEKTRQVLKQRAKRRLYEVWPEHWHAVCVFAAMETQWRMHVVMGGTLWQGLDYAALPVVLAGCREVPHRRPLSELMPQLRTMELAALEELNR